ARDVGFDAGAEVAQLAIDPAALDHVLNAKPDLFVEGHIVDAKRLGPAEIVTTGKAAIGNRLSRRLAIEGDVAIEHGEEAFAVGGVAGFDHQVEHQAALASGQVEFVAIFNVAAAFDDNVGMRLEQADDLVAGGDGFTVKNPTLGLCDDPFDQWAIVVELALPERHRHRV